MQQSRPKPTRPRARGVRRRPRAQTLLLEHGDTFAGGELEGSDGAGAYQAQDQRTYQSDKAAQDLCRCSGVQGRRAVAESQGDARLNSR